MAGELRWKQRSPDSFNHRVTNGCDLTGSRQLLVPMATKDRDQLLRLEHIGCPPGKQILNLGMLFSAKCTVHDRPLCNGLVHLSWLRWGCSRRRVERQDIRRSSPMRIIHATALSGFVRKTAESTSDFASVVRNLIMDVRDSYRPELHYMRGPGPKWRAKHQGWLKFARTNNLAPNPGRTERWDSVAHAKAIIASIERKSEKIARDLLNAALEELK